MVSNFQFWGDQDGEWPLIQQRNSQAAIGLYDQALRIAPGHCQAIFGRAVASVTLLTQNPTLDAFMEKVNNSGPRPDRKMESRSRSFSLGDLMNLPPDEVVPFLLNVSANLRRVDLPTLMETQNLIETVAIPKLDSTIAEMEKVRDFPKFAIRFSIDGDTVEIDQSEIGPGLAGLKVMKAFLTLVAGYEWEMALDGKYDWMDTLYDMPYISYEFDTGGDYPIKDYDNLSVAQSRALDHLTSLFNQTSPFSKVKPAWRARVQGIPDLLLDAVDDTQFGLMASISEAAQSLGQEFDPWRAGGKDADVDTLNLRIAVEALERSKKFISGEVPVLYEKGGRILKVNFSRVFAVDELQSLLPYFRILPYPQWNDTVTFVTEWNNRGYLPYGEKQEALLKLGYGDLHMGSRWDVVINYTAKMTDTGRVYLRNGSSFPTFVDTLLATFWSDPNNPCAFHFSKEYDLVGTATRDRFEIAQKESSGNFRLEQCKEDGGQLTFPNRVLKIRGPIEYTNAEGITTLTLPGLSEVDDPKALSGKIIFRDPTFGGIFPELTNTNIWDYIQSLEPIEAQNLRTCALEADAEGTQVWTCRRSLMQSPSDLDYFMIALYWGDDLL